MTNYRELGLERGRIIGKRALEQGLAQAMPREFAMNLELFPSLGPGFDMAREVLAYDAHALECAPSLSKFPETKGLAERAVAEREGFIESSGLTPVHAAFHYSFWSFIWKHVNARHVARYDLVSAPTQCTNIFFPEGAEGAIIANNRDDLLFPWYRHVPTYREGPVPEGYQVGWRQGAVSSSILLDDEPECPFPYDPYEFIPPECFDDIRALVAYMDERRDFWGPGNQIWVDTKLNAVAVEKSNVRAAYRYAPSNGAVCITAGSYLDPALTEFKTGRLQEVARRKGDAPDDCPDILFSDGCDQRYNRLVQLTNEEAGRPGGATLWGAFEIVSDTAAPFPARICLAGERTHPREANGNWTLTQSASVLTGSRRRTLYRSIQSLEAPRAITEETPKFVLGENVEMQPEWLRDIENGKCELA